MGIQHFPRFRRCDAAFGANQQLLIQFAFQRSNLLAQRGLRDMQHFRCLGQATNIDDFHEIFQSSEVHFASCRNTRTRAGSH